MKFLCELWWKFYAEPRLARKLDALTLPQLNLIEARIREDGKWCETFEQLFDDLRSEKVSRA